MPASRFATLVEMLGARARHSGERAAFRFGGRDFTFAEIWESTERFAACLLTQGLQPGDRAVLVLPNGGEFFTAFYGAQRAGVVAVPIFPDSGAERVLTLAELCGARAIVVAQDTSASVRERIERQAHATDLRVLDVTEEGTPAQATEFPAVEPGDLSYIQYTSGSTGDPKGVLVTHAMALVNVEQLIAGMAITADEVFVSWLPVHHDMGLVLMTMVPFYLGARLVLLPASLTHVRRWLDAIERYRATFIAAPDFAYRLCLRRIKKPADHDLSSLRVALNAAEPVRASTIEEFHSAFGLEDVMVPGYGLAEATVGVSMAPPGVPIAVDDRGFVSVGRAFAGIDVAIVREGERVGAGEVGEIAIRSPANTRGYYRNPRATAELFWHGDYLRTGDLGYLDAGGELFVVGREKNIIIHGGCNVAPREVEEIVDRAPFVRRSAAVGIDRGRLEGEQVWVFAEVRGKPGAEDLETMTVAIVRALHDALGFRPGRVLLVRPRAVPLTHNGKIRHRALRDHYLDGSLRRRGQILFPSY